MTHAWPGIPPREKEGKRGPESGQVTPGSKRKVDSEIETWESDRQRDTESNRQLDRSSNTRLGNGKTMKKENLTDN